MNVRLGWSGEVDPNIWRKVDVSVDETDLRRILIAAGLPETDLYTVPTSLVFILLENEAERLLLAQLTSRHGYPAEMARTRLAELATARTTALATLREHLRP